MKRTIVAFILIVIAFASGYIYSETQKTPCTAKRAAIEALLR